MDKDTGERSMQSALETFERDLGLVGDLREIDIMNSPAPVETAGEEN